MLWLRWRRFSLDVRLSFFLEGVGVGARVFGKGCCCFLHLGWRVVLSCS